MPNVNDEFDRTCVRLDLDPERSAIFTPTATMLQFREDDLRVFNQCLARIVPGTPALSAEQMAGAVRRLVRAVGVGNQSRFIQSRMRRAGEIRAILKDQGWTLDREIAARMQDLIGYLDGPVALVPLHLSTIGGLDRALLVDVAMASLRVELDEYADYCRYRVAEAQRLGVPTQSVNVDRETWMRERSEELRLERMIRRGGRSRDDDRGGMFRVS